MMNKKNFKSKELYEKAIQADPANPEPWANLAMATMEVDGAKKALDVYAEPKDGHQKSHALSQCWLHPASQFQKLQRSRESNFREALKIAPKLYQSRAGLGETLLRKGSYREALKALQEAAKMPEAKDPKRAKELNGYIKECKIKLAPKKKKEEKNNCKSNVVAPVTPSAPPATVICNGNLQIDYVSGC